METARLSPQIQPSALSEFDSEKFAKRLREKRKEKFKSREKMANAIADAFPYDMTKTFAERIKEYESGNCSNPKIDNVLKMAKVLDCDPGFLFGFYDESTKNIHDIAEMVGLSEGAIRELANKEYLGLQFQQGNWKLPTTYDILSEFIVSKTAMHAFLHFQMLFFSVCMAKVMMTAGSKDKAELQSLMEDITNSSYQFKLILDCFMDDITYYKDLTKELTDYIADLDGKAVYLGELEDVDGKKEESQ